MIRITTPEIQEFETRHISKLRKLAPECMVLLSDKGTVLLSCRLFRQGDGSSVLTG